MSSRNGVASLGSSSPSAGVQHRELNPCELSRKAARLLITENQRPVLCTWFIILAHFPRSVTATKAQLLPYNARPTKGLLRIHNCASLHLTIFFIIRLHHSMNVKRYRSSLEISVPIQPKISLRKIKKHDPSAVMLARAAPPAARPLAFPAAAAAVCPAGGATGDDGEYLSWHQRSSSPLRQHCQNYQSFDFR